MVEACGLLDTIPIQRKGKAWALIKWRTLKEGVEKLQPKKDGIHLTTCAFFL